MPRLSAGAFLLITVGCKMKGVQRGPLFLKMEHFIL